MKWKVGKLLFWDEQGRREADFSPSFCLQGGNDLSAYGEPELPHGWCQPLKRDCATERFAADPEHWSLTVVHLAMCLITLKEKLCDAPKPQDSSGIFLDSGGASILGGGGVLGNGHCAFFLTNRTSQQLLILFCLAMYHLLGIYFNTVST